MCNRLLSKWSLSFFVIMMANHSLSAAERTNQFVEGELLVKFRATSQLNKPSASIRQKVRSKHHFPALNVEHWKLPVGTSTADVIQQLKNDPAVEIVEPNYRRYPRATPAEINAKTYSDARIDQVGLRDLWNKPVTRTTKVKVAVIDDAFNVDHPDLAGNIASGFDGLDGDQDPRPEVCIGDDGQAVTASNGSNTEDHGTEVLGVLGAVRGNNLGIDGAGDNADIYPIRIGCNYTVAAELAAVEWAIQQDVDIISISYGGPMYSELERVAFQNALHKDILVVVAAGNFDMDNDRVPDYPSGLDLPNIFSIAGTTESNELAEWSQWGQTSVDLAAPGERIGTTFHASNSTIEYTNSLGGTSFSAPLVSGIVASLMARDPFPDPEQKFGQVFRAKAALMQSVKPFVKTPKARLAVDGYVDALAAWEKLKSLEPVIVIKSITIDDSVSGNNNGEVDPGETVSLKLVLENQGSDASNVIGNLISTDLSLTDGSFQIDNAGYDPVNNSYGQIEVSFDVNFESLQQKQNILFQLSLSGSYFFSSKAFSATRFFTIDTGSLTSGTTVSNTIRKDDDNQDEFHYYHIDVPANSKKLTITLAKELLNDLDLLVKKDSAPQFNYVDYPFHNTLSDAVEEGVLVSANSNVTEEVISIDNPSAGTYHIVVVANDNEKESNIDYTLTADLGEVSSVSTRRAGINSVFLFFVLAMMVFSRKFEL